MKVYRSCGTDCYLGEDIIDYLGFKFKSPKEMVRLFNIPADLWWVARMNSIDVMRSITNRHIDNIVLVAKSWYESKFSTIIPSPEPIPKNKIVISYKTEFDIKIYGTLSRDDMWIRLNDLKIYTLSSFTPTDYVWHKDYKIFENPQEYYLSYDLTLIYCGTHNLGNWLRSKIGSLVDHPADETQLIIIYNDHYIKEYFKNDKVHREDGPAYIKYYLNGIIANQTWFIDNRRHSIDDKFTSAWYHPNGMISDVSWYIDDKRQRENDKPTYISWNDDGRLVKKIWFIDGRYGRKSGAHAQETFYCPEPKTYDWLNENGDIIQSQFQRKIICKGSEHIVAEKISPEKIITEQVLCKDTMRALMALEYFGKNNNELVYNVHKKFINLKKDYQDLIVEYVDKDMSNNE